MSGVLASIFAFLLAKEFFRDILPQIKTLDTKVNKIKLVRRGKSWPFLHNGVRWSVFNDTQVTNLVINQDLLGKHDVGHFGSGKFNRSVWG